MENGAAGLSAAMPAVLTVYQKVRRCLIVGVVIISGYSLGAREACLLQWDALFIRKNLHAPLVHTVSIGPHP